uniref:Choline O-acetyltransferase n=1 Tax=Meloidogyne floridensis TaxID=298350 RepID=A0A915PD58_9BILA
MEATTIINNNILINDLKEINKENKKLVEKIDGWNQYLLLKPPIPDLKHTLTRYLEYSSVLAQTYKLDFDKTIENVKKFEETIGPKLQQKLKEISFKEDNWETKERDYAALLIKGFLDFREKVEGKEIPLETVPDRFIGGKSVPMCMDQYERIFNFYRQPSFNEDILFDKRRKNNEKQLIEHILILYKNQQFILFIKTIEGILINLIQIIEQLGKIMEMARNRNIQNIIPIGGSGTGGRDRAAKFWEEMNKDQINQNSLELARSSIFVLCLDDENIDNIDNLNQMQIDGMQILYGFGPEYNGLNRWFDSTIQLIVSKNGCCGTCIEHSIAEGIKKQKEQKCENNLTIIEPKPLSWVVSEKANLLLGEQIVEFEQLTNNLQLNLLQFNEFGKDSIKGWGVSPDGFMQLCMQLAHFRLHGYLVNSYESATMRRFRFGRVDNIRAATPEALNWVKSMNNPNEEKKRKRILLKMAFDKQSLITKENLIGNGIDNHLCALEVLSREEFGLENLPEIFQDEMWKEMMRFPLSTSQVSTSPEFINCYLYYGPVVDDGYGCAYNIQPNSLIFAISTWKSNKRTNGELFKLKLIESLKEIKELLEFSENLIQK